MKKTYLIILLAVCTMIANVSKADAHESLGLSLNIGSPFYYGPAPVYVAPPPVYYTPPPTVYYRPAPGYYYAPGMRIEYYDRPGRDWHHGPRHHWRGHDRD